MSTGPTIVKFKILQVVNILDVKFFHNLKISSGTSYNNMLKSEYFRIEILLKQYGFGGIMITKKELMGGLIKLVDVVDPKQIDRIGLPKKFKTIKIPAFWKDAEVTYKEDEIILRVSFAKLELGFYNVEGHPETIYLINTGYADEYWQPATEEDHYQIMRDYRDKDNNIVMLDN